MKGAEGKLLKTVRRSAFGLVHRGEAGGVNGRGILETVAESEARARAPIHDRFALSLTVEFLSGIIPP